MSDKATANIPQTHHFAWTKHRDGRMAFLVALTLQCFEIEAAGVMEDFKVAANEFSATEQGLLFFDEGDQVTIDDFVPNEILDVQKFRKLLAAKGVDILSFGAIPVGMHFDASKALIDSVPASAAA